MSASAGEAPTANAPTTPKTDNPQKPAVVRKTTVKRSGNAGAKKHLVHPSYGAMIKAALKHLNDRKGSSRAAIFKYIIQNYKLGGNMTMINSHLRMALKRGVQSGSLKQAKGTGASGSFRLGEGKASKIHARKATKKPRAKKATGPKSPTEVKKTRVEKKKKSPAKKPKMTKKLTGAKRKSASKKSAAGGVKKVRSPKKPLKKSTK